MEQYEFEDWVPTPEEEVITGQELVDRGYLEEVLHDEAEVEQKVGELADQILEAYQDDEELPTLVSLRSGGDWFAASLLSALEERTDKAIRLVGMRTKGYSGQHQLEETTIVEDIANPEETIRGKKVLVVDDVFDTGDTSQTVHDHLTEVHGAIDVQFAVLASKEVERGAHVTVKPRFVGFEVENRWLVGVGMNLDRHPYKHAYRKLGAIVVARALGEDPLETQAESEIDEDVKAVLGPRGLRDDDATVDEENVVYIYPGEDPDRYAELKREEAA